MRLHTGEALPGKLIETVRGWDQRQVTPGWLEEIPATIAALCAKWQITIERVVPETWVTLVLLGHSPTLGPVVIKSSALGDEFRAEATALRLAAGERVVRIYDLDLDRGVMVLERIVPGTQLRDAVFAADAGSEGADSRGADSGPALSDDAATRLAAETLPHFWREVPEASDVAALHPLRRWMRALFAWQPRPELIAPELIGRAQELGEALLAGSRRSCLLHGDYQHHNLLLGADGTWIIIDPKGLYGDPGFEFAAWMYNPEGVTARADYRELARRRAAICSEIWGIPERTLLEWAFVGAVLSMCWWNFETGPAELSEHFSLGARQLLEVVNE